MKHFKTWWLLVVVILAIPYGLVLLAGTVWLYQQGWLWYWMALSGIVTVICWQTARWLQRRRSAPDAVRVSPPLEWPPATLAVWDQVEAIAARVEREDLPLDRPDPAWQVLKEVLATVAGHYHPKARQPELQIPAPHVLKIVELVAADLREALTQTVPGVHLLTLSDLQTMKRMADWAGKVYIAYRVASFAYDPLAAFVRELRDVAGRGLKTTSGSEIKRWAVGYCVRKSGYYAIRLYSGDLVLDDVAFQDFTTADSRQDARRDPQQSDPLGEEPLRILVLGQVNAGKSSLINALFGECRAAVDVVPRTRGVQPYVLEHDGIRRAIILDTAGYDTDQPDDDPFEELHASIVRTDLVIAVCSATSAARGIDRRLLDRVRAHFQQNPDRSMPPVVVAVTHIDQLRPLSEWNPPYNVAHARGGKAVEIRQAAQAVADDLEVPPDAVVPVCLKPGYEYNLADGFVPAIVHASPQALRVKYQRCLREFRRRENWQQLWRQAVKAGRLLLARNRS